MKGVIAAGAAASAEAGCAMFRQGGNAYDAAVAAAFASLIAECSVVNIGGGGYALVADEVNDPVAYDFFPCMPTHDPSQNMDFRQVVIDFGVEQQPFYIGRASTAVPGFVAGLCRLAGERGSLGLDQLLAPAITMARDGLTVSPYTAFILRLLGPIFSDTPALHSLVSHGDQFLSEGQMIRMPQLANTLERLASEGSDLFYRGSVADAIVHDHQLHGGLITGADLHDYQVISRQPLSIDYRGYEVLLPPPSSNGGTLIGFALKLLESVSLTSYEPNSPEHLTLLTHVMALTSKARPSWDRLTGSGSQRVQRFLDPEHIDQYRQALTRLMDGGPLPESSPPMPGPGNTSHISAMDERGNAVSITTSSGENSGYLVGDTGVCLNNILGELDLNPHGFHKDPRGARLGSMMSPALVLDRGKPILSLGSAGSNRIRSAVLQTLSNRLDFGMSLENAVNQSRVHFEAGMLQAEAGIKEEAVIHLRGCGYKVKVWGEKNLFFGGAQAVSIDGGLMDGAGDVRRGGQVALNQA